MDDKWFCDEEAGMKCLYELNYELLEDLVKGKLNLENWLIRNQDIRRRKDAISYSDRYAILKNTQTTRLRPIRCCPSIRRPRACSLTAAFASDMSL